MRDVHLEATVRTQEQMIEDEEAQKHAACQLFKELQRRERRRKKKKKKKQWDDDDDTYHPSQDYNGDSQIDPKFRVTRRELREADEEGDSYVKGSGKAIRLYICRYVDQCTCVLVS